jgi:hypothetical protein
LLQKVGWENLVLSGSSSHFLPIVFEYVEWKTG